MPDIAMCSGDGCEIKSTCYRYRATPSEYHQSYFVTPPTADLQCDFYWEFIK